MTNEKHAVDHTRKELKQEIHAYKATSEQWEVQEKFAPESEDACCLLELRARVEILEACMYQFRCDHLRLANTCASMAPDRSKFFADLMPDEELRAAELEQ